MELAMPKSLFEALGPLHKACYLFGLVAFYRERTTKIGIAAYILSFLRITLWVLGSMKDNFQQVENEQIFYNKILLRVNLVSGFTLLTTECILGTVFSQKIYNFIDDLQKVDKDMYWAGISKIYRRTYRRVFLSVGFIAALIVLFLIMGGPFLREFSIFSLCLMFADFSPMSVTAFMDIQYVNYTKLLKDRYKSVNERLMSLAKETMNENDNWEAPVKIVHPGKNNRVESLQTATIKTDALAIVDLAVSIHIKLNNAAKSLHKAFCVQILLMITVCFIGTVCAIYFLILRMFEEGTMQTLNSNASYVCWTLTNVVEVLILVLSASTLCEEANTCPRILHTIRNYTEDIKLQDKVLFAFRAWIPFFILVHYLFQIDVYSLQMYHNRLQFYVCGLFPLDNSLLYTIVAGITTYLVILIQFQSANFPGSN